jgi:peptidoglycan/LPS O-acetylase OafA/YrhL
VGDRDSGARNANLERLRILGALGIVCFHTQQGLAKAIGYAGLPVFLLLTVALAIGPEPAPFRKFARARAARLLLPWAAWLLVYLAFDLAIAAARGEPPAGVLARFNPFYGTELVLWYLPFAFYALGAAQLLHRGLWRAASLGVVAWLALAGVCVAVLPWALGDPPSAPLPVPQFTFAAPSVLWGMAIAYAARLEGRRRGVGLAVPVVAVYVSAAALAILGATSGVDDLFFAYGPGVVLVCAGVVWPGPPLGRAAAALAPLTYGIYLAHPLVLSVLERVPGLDAHDPRYGAPLVFALAAAVAAALRRGPALRRIV